jgi:hypothetical protein
MLELPIEKCLECRETTLFSNTHFALTYLPAPIHVVEFAGATMQNYRILRIRKVYSRVYAFAGMLFALLHVSTGEKERKKVSLSFRDCLGLTCTYVSA